MFIIPSFLRHGCQRGYHLGEDKSTGLPVQAINKFLRSVGPTSQRDFLSFRRLFPSARTSVNCALTYPFDSMFQVENRY